MWRTASPATGAARAAPAPLGPISYHLTARRDGDQLQPITPPLKLVTQRNASGYDLAFGQVYLPEGQVRGHAVPPGSYQLEVRGAFYQPMTLDVVVPRLQPPLSCALEPGVAYPFPDPAPLRLGNLGPDSCVAPDPHHPEQLGLPAGRGPTLLRGTFSARDGQPVVGATVRVAGQSNQCVTDDSGSWVLVFPDTQPTGPVTVSVQWPDPPGTTDTIPGVCVVRGRVTSLAQTALRGWVLTQAGNAIPAATIAVGDLPGTVQADAQGAWFYYCGLHQEADTVNVVATLPNGDEKVQPNVPIRPRATVVVDTFRFT